MKYSELLLAKLFSYSSCCYALQPTSLPYVFEQPSARVFQFYKDHHYHALTHPIIAKMTSSIQDTLLVCKLFKHILEDIKDEVLANLLTAEVLAKVLSYRNLQKDSTLSIPIKLENKQMVAVPYKIDIIINLWQNVSCFGLLPLEKEHPPLLIFPGTDFSLLSKRGRASIINDLDPEGPGRSLFFHARSQIQAWLQKATTTTLCCLIGHSLGSILAAYVMIWDHEWISKTSNSFLFNYPGLELDMLQKWMELDTQKKPKTIGLIGRGDIVSKYGYLFSPSYEMALDSPQQPISSHTTLFFAHPFSQLHPIHINQENSSSSRKQYSKLYKKTSLLFYYSGLKYFFPNYYQ